MRLNWIKNGLKIVGINVVITICLLGLVLIVPALWSDLRHALKGKTDASASAKYALPLYQNEPWAKQHFIEFGRLNTQYHDFFGWRRTRFDGETITVDDAGYRRHTSLAKSPEQAGIWVFGGSTVWGTGSSDNGTIPAQIEKITGKGTFNFGESGYVAHQSLNLLMRQYVAGGKPSVVIFYDGVNEVAHKCRTELDFFSSSREQQIRKKLGGDSGSQFIKLFEPLAEGLRQSISSSAKPSKKEDPRFFNCHTNTKKADLIAKNLIQDWDVARRLVEKNGGKFIAVLQPVTYLGTPTLRHLPEKERDSVQKLQYESVYPLIREQAARMRLAYIDLTGIFDGPEPVYIDFCHVIPNGNRKVAMAISRKF